MCKNRWIVILGTCLLLWVSAGHGEEAAHWNETLQRVSTAVVTIQVDAARAFDTSSNSSSQATGFVVDAEQGLILTNRHVVQSGPVVAEAFFENREAVELIPVYRDPVHDFGLFRYDPNALKYIQPQALTLKPEAAEVGREIRVIGNDAGEQRSILAGTLARLDRSAPYYGFGTYNDFNTFYLQAASGVSGGSSGSPVVDIKGDVLGLNAGGNQTAASSFFLPLERVRRVLELIRKGQPVSRGGLLTTFQYTPYNELRRLGLREQTEQQLRDKGKGIGMLVVSAVLPQGPADGLLQPGDILIKVNDRWINHFAELEALLDEQVGKEITLGVERGGRPLTVRVPVADLHSVTPDRYLGFGNAILHDLSYQQARQLNKPLTGVYVAASGYILASAGVPPGSVITAIEDEPVTDLASFNRAVEGLLDGQKVVLRFYSFSEPNREQVAVMSMDRRWFPVEICRRDDSKGYWPCDILPVTADRVPTEGGVVHFEPYADPRAERLSASLVHISFNIPYQLDGVAGNHYLGVGLVVDAEHGLLVTDRNTVPVAMGDVTLTFGGALEIPGRVVFVHPTHNLVFVQYDPALLEGSPVRSAQLNTEPLQSSDPIWLVGLNGNQRLQVHATQVAAIEPLQIPLSRVPMFRETNLDSIRLNNPPPMLGGVLTDAQGRVRALWSSFSFGHRNNFTQFNSGMAIELVDDLLKQWRCCQQLLAHSLEVELALLPLSKARTLGLPDSWAEQIQQNGFSRQLLMVSRLVAGSSAASLLQEGDLLVAIDGSRVHGFRDVERLSDKPAVKVTVIRKGQELVFEVATVAYKGRGTDHIVLWAGALLQKPYRSVAAQLGLEPQGAFVSTISSGSPASRYHLPRLSRIVAVDDQPVAGLDDFVRLVTAKGNPDSLRLKVINLLGRESIVTLKPDNRYWPMREIRWQSGEWQRIEHASQHAGATH